MEVISGIIHAISRILTITVFIISMYYLCISFFGIWRKKDRRDVKPKKSFALIVAAHNEEIVIGNVVDSLNNLDYPKELYDVYVIADNCTDKTALNAESRGAIT